MEEAELLVSVCGIICGFHIQNDQIPVAWVKGNIQIHQRLARADHVLGCHCVFKPAQGGLGGHGITPLREPSAMSFNVGSSLRQPASFASSYPSAMQYTLCRNNSNTSCLIRAASRMSPRQEPSCFVTRYFLLNKDAPPSELAAASVKIHQHFLAKHIWKSQLLVTKFFLEGTSAK